MPSSRTIAHALQRVAPVGLLFACSGSVGLEPPSESPFVQGPVATITPALDGSVLLVHAGPGSREPCGIAATVSARTRVLQRSAADGALRRADLRSFRVGDTVEVYVDLVADSCPTQGAPTTLVLR